MRPQHDIVAAIPTQPVEGRVRGLPFVVRDARYAIQRRDGDEHLELLLSDATSVEPCGALTPARPARIWLRHRGSELPLASEIRVRPEAGPADAHDADSWEVHYQLVQDGRWVGNGTASALLRLTTADGSLDLRGSLSVCFADRHASCAAGTFVARYCPSDIDRPLRGVVPPESPAALPVRTACASPQLHPCGDH